MSTIEDRSATEVTTGDPWVIGGETCTLTAAYERCRQLHAAHGKTYYLATMLLPEWKRRHVHALYGFVRYADEIVDDLSSNLTGEEKAAHLHAWGEQFFAGLEDGRNTSGMRAGSGQDRSTPDGRPAVTSTAVGAGRPERGGTARADGRTATAPVPAPEGWHPGYPADRLILPAVRHTVRAFGLDVEDFRKFMRSMAMDLTVDDYATYDDLLVYMDGSAAVIGTMMNPVLEPADPDAAREYARQLGLAFQLTNFVRDVGEDLARGRVYLPTEDLERFDVTREMLAAGKVTAEVRALLAFEVERARGHYRAAEPGIELLAPSSRPAIRAARILYGGILDEVERAGYQVLRRRVKVPNRRRAAVFLRSLREARAAARAEARATVLTPR